jgi:dihydropyrimidinase
VKTHHQNVDFNIYEGMSVTGVAKRTVAAGKIVWDDGDLRPVRGAGKYIPRPCFSPVIRAVRRQRGS